MNEALENALDYMVTLISQEWDFCDAQFKASRKFNVSAQELSDAYDTIVGKPI